jgi:sulfite exporter TauE/SafE
MDLFFPMLLLGLATSVHCVAMCGSIVATYAVKDGTACATGQSVPLGRRARPHVVYQTAKIMSYVLVGLALGAIGAAFDLGGVRGWVTIAAGVFMVLLGLNMAGLAPWFKKLVPRAPRFLTDAFKRTRRKAKDDADEGRSSLTTPATFGMLTGLMPCGPLQSAQLAAVAAGSAAAGATAMLGFGLGTAPLMLGFGVASGFLGARFKNRLMVVAAILIMGFGLVMVNRGAMLVGSPITYDTVRQAVLGAPDVAVDADEYSTSPDGYVEVPLTISDVQFVPSTLSIPADKPVRLIVDRQEDHGCSDQLAVPQLGVLEDLTPFGTTVVELPAAEAGSYTLTCGMGMMAGQILVGGAAAGAGSSMTWVLLFGGGVVLAALVWLLFRLQRGGAASSGGPRGSSGGRKRRSTAPEAAGILGFTLTQVLLIGVAILTAVLLGLVLGGGP